MKFDDLLDFARRFPDVGNSIVADVARETYRGAYDQVRSGTEALTPRASGTMASSWRDQPSPESAIAALEPMKRINTAPHARIIDIGRRKSKNAFKVRGRRGTVTVPAGKQLGSKQAPRGIAGPVMRQVKRAEDATIAAAIAKVEAKYA